ncbi:MAG: hypothetical protein ABIP42_02145, partial [Planctomycetota bacterium]
MEDHENSTAKRVLGAHEFELFLARERDLADRGTRLFSLMVLGDRDARGNLLRQLASKLRERLRATDLVALSDSAQIWLLLSDTNPAGAQIIGDWTDKAAAELGIQLDAMIYVYPSVDEALGRVQDEDQAPQGPGPSNGSGNGQGSSGSSRRGPTRQDRAQDSSGIEYGSSIG